MTLRYPIILWLCIGGAALFAALAFFYKRNKQKDGEVKLANTDIIFEDKYIRKQMLKYYILRVVLVFSVLVMVILSGVLLARPYYIKKIKEQKYNRDIILCMDISASVDDLNLKLVKELQDTVRSLSGERIGIVIFNTTPVVLVPLTDDYEYVIEQLENIRTAIKSQKGNFSFGNEDWLYWHEYLYGGTLVGNEIRGSSLIGDGLLGGLFAFPEMNSNRTKVIIFSTDNDPNGEGYVNLTEAAEYCKRNNCTVYGIGTKLMYNKDREEMEAAVKSTGGKFFLEENASQFHEIVDEIEAKSVDLTEGKTIIKMIESPAKWFGLLVICFVLFVVVSLLLRRANILWGLGSVAMCASLVLVYLYAVIPAKQFSMGPDLDVKKTSNLNVLFVVDNTISMVANDAMKVRGSGEFDVPWQDDGSRLVKAKYDASQIVDELEGARFSVIAFNNDAMLLAPFSQNADHVKNAIKSMYPLERYYARGSSLDTPKELMATMLKQMKTGEDQVNAVFFISDGEITSENAVLSSFSDLSEYVDGGAVLGYGTKEGATMLYKDSYSEEYEIVQDYSEWPNVDAVSKVDEDNLKKIAEDLGIQYVNMTEAVIPTDGDTLMASNDAVSSAEMAAALAVLKSKIKTEEQVTKKDDTGDKYIEPPKYYGYYAMIPFMLLLLGNAWYVVRRK